MNLNGSMKSIGLGLIGIGAFGCVIFPLDYIPHNLYFLREQKPVVIWSVLIGLIVVGGVLWYMGSKSEKAAAEKEKQQQG